MLSKMHQLSVTSLVNDPKHARHRIKIVQDLHTLSGGSKWFEQRRQKSGFHKAFKTQPQTSGVFRTVVQLGCDAVTKISPIQLIKSFARSAAKIDRFSLLLKVNVFQLDPIEKSTTNCQYQRMYQKHLPLPLEMT